MSGSWNRARLQTVDVREARAAVVEVVAGSAQRWHREVGAPGVDGDERVELSRAASTLKTRTGYTCARAGVMHARTWKAEECAWCLWKMYDSDHTVVLYGYTPPRS